MSGLGLMGGIVVCLALVLACGGGSATVEPPPDEPIGDEPAEVLKSEPAIEATDAEVTPSEDTEGASSGDEAAAADASAGQTSGTAHGKVYGTLSKVSGKTLVVSLQGAVPGSGATGKLFKKVKKQLGKMSFEAWLDVADVTVKSVSGADVTLTVTQENSVVTVNGQKKSHFDTGAAVRLEW